MLDVELAKHPGFEAAYFYRGLDGHGDNDCLIFYKDEVICNLEGWNWDIKTSWGSASRLKSYTARLMEHVAAGHLKLHSKFSSVLFFAGGARKQHCMAGYAKAGWTIYGHRMMFTAQPLSSQIKWLKNSIERLVKKLVKFADSNNVLLQALSMPVKRANGVVSTVYELLARLIARILLVFRDRNAQRTLSETHLSIRSVDLIDEAKIADVGKYLYIAPFAYVREDINDA